MFFEQIFRRCPTNLNILDSLSLKLSLTECVAFSMVFVPSYFHFLGILESLLLPEYNCNKYK